MFKKFMCMLALAGTISLSTPLVSSSMVKNCSDKETHTGLKRTLNKSKMSLRKTSNKLRSSKIKATTVKMTTTPSTEVSKLKARVKSDDELRDQQERSK